MERKKKHYFLIAGLLFLLFVIFTIAVRMIDVQPIGPEGSRVGFATLNGAVFNALGTSEAWYTITKWLGYIPIFIVIGFAILGIAQWITRKGFTKIDKSILVLGGFYVLVGIAYVFFELFIVNYRPVLLSEQLEASYPSSHTMLVICVMVTAMMQFRNRIQNKIGGSIVMVLSIAIILLMVVGRLLSGVHWCTDIIGSILLSSALIMLYVAMIHKVCD